MPTVVRSRASFLFSRRRVNMAARAAAQRLAERKETMVHTCWTAMQSDSEGSRPRFTRISLVLARPSLYLARGQEERPAPLHAVAILQGCVLSGMCALSHNNTVCPIVSALRTAATVY